MLYRLLINCVTIFALFVHHCSSFFRYRCLHRFWIGFWIDFGTVLDPCGRQNGMDNQSKISSNKKSEWLGHAGRPRDHERGGVGSLKPIQFNDNWAENCYCLRTHHIRAARARWRIIKLWAAVAHWAPTSKTNLGCESKSINQSLVVLKRPSNHLQKTVDDESFQNQCQNLNFVHYAWSCGHFNGKVQHNSHKTTSKQLLQRWSGDWGGCIDQKSIKHYQTSMQTRDAKKHQQMI